MQIQSEFMPQYDEVSLDVKESNNTTIKNFIHHHQSTNSNIERKAD
jgi:hypothetical protein